MLGLNKSSPNHIWTQLRQEAESSKASEPALVPMLQACVISKDGFGHSLAFVISERLASVRLNALDLGGLIYGVYEKESYIVRMAEEDFHAVMERDPAATSMLPPFLFYKGFHALQAYRVAHQLWLEGRHFPALMIQSLMSEKFAVDIHPAAQIGKAVMMDHATGIVVGETAVIGDGSSLLHDVTLGGTGHETGDRHPKIGTGVMIGAGAKVLGNIKVGDYARIAAGSVVLDEVPAHVTVAGVPARVVGKAGCAKPAEQMDQRLPADDASI